MKLEEEIKRLINLFDEWARNDIEDALKSSDPYWQGFYLGRTRGYHNALENLENALNSLKDLELYDTSRAR